MALLADANYNSRGQSPTSTVFGYLPTTGAIIYRNALVGLTAAGTIQRIQDANTVVFVGLADRASNTPQQPITVGHVDALKGVWQLTVPGASYSQIGAAVYATDDNTLTLTAGSNLQVGTLAGIDFKGNTYVKLLGS